jgi:1,4-dihydroxy-6-naphthoate synthase
MPALARGEADYGVVIHEGRFTFEGFGLKREVDLGQLWEERYQLPLPLGCLVARRSLGGELIEQFEDVVRASLNYSLANKSEAYSTMRRYAQELDEAAIWGHVDLYVNQWSLELGELGTAAFKQLAQVCEEIETRAPGLGFL